MQIVFTDQSVEVSFTDSQDTGDLRPMAGILSLKFLAKIPQFSV